MIELTEDQAKRIVEHIYDAEGDKMGSYVAQASAFIEAINGDADCGIEIVARDEEAEAA